MSNDIFKKPIPIKTFEKRFLKYIEQPHDKDFFKSCFTEQNETYVIRESINDDEEKKLRKLLKRIKSNKRGALKIIPLLFAAAVIAAIVIFFTVFANPLLESALENGLEAIFEARAEVDHLRLSLIKFEIRIDGITVANRDKPMTNLFQLGKIVISLKPQAVLRGKVYIEEISADDIRFATARKTSGALPFSQARVKPVRQKEEAPPLIDLRNFDAMALLNQEYDKLSTPRLYDEAINAYNEMAVRWPARVNESKQKVEELRAEAQSLTSMNASSFSNVETATREIQKITSMLNKVQSMTTDVTKIVNDLETDVNTALRLEANARNAIANDINHLRSYIDLGSGAAFSALEPFIRDVLSDAGDQYFDYGLMALETLEKLKARSASKPKNEKPKKEPKVVFRGRDVPFPVVSYPSFYLGKLATKITIPNGTWSGTFDLQNVSSEPELTYRQTGRPVSLNLTVSEQGGNLSRQAGFNGRADFRDNPEERFYASVTGGGFPVSLGDQLKGAGIGGFTGNTGFKIFLSGRPDGGFTGGGDVSLSQSRLLDPKGTLAEAVAAAVSETSSINLGIEYRHLIGQRDEFKITTNIAELIGRALRNIASAYTQQAIAEVERVLRARIEQYIDGRFVSKDEVDALLRIARGDKAAVEQLKGLLDSKKAEFERWVRDQTTKQLQNIAPNIPVPNIPIPRLPF